jgi:hypothetical protein
MINFSSIPEEMEAPSIVNIREHYLPSVLFLYRRKKEQSRPTNIRKKVNIRNTAKRKLTFTSFHIKGQAMSQKQ